MKFGVKNLGVLKEAEIDLAKDLLILCGPNNTGKTYLAYAAYGICKFLRGKYREILVRALPSMDGATNLWQEVLESDFSVKSGFFKEVKVNLGTEEGIEKLFLSNQRVKEIYFFPAERIAINVFSKELSIRRNELVDELLKTKDKKIKTQDDFFHFLGRKANRYPRPVRDSLRIAEDLEFLQKTKSDFAYLGEMIENEILKGRISVSENGAIQYTPDGTKQVLETHLTASMVKSLTSIVFYFKHLAKKNDFIIIDEPELNLHPDNQRLVAKMLVRIVNEGFKVMLSTHSDYLIREFNNLIMLKSKKPEAKKLMKKYGYVEKDLLDFNKVGAYLFKEDKNFLLEVDETGFEVETIDEEINKLNQTSQEIYFTLYD